MVRGKKNGFSDRVRQASARLLSVADSLSPVVYGLMLLGLRFWIGLVFWKSALTKIENWDTTLFLFEEEYQVPILSAELAAFLGTSVELIAPLLLFMGLGTRLAVVPLLVMAAVIQFSYQMHHDHLLWALALFALMIQGAGLFSWDFFIRTRGNTDEVGYLWGGWVFLSFSFVVLITVIIGHDAMIATGTILGSDAFEAWNPWLDGILEHWNSIGSGE